MTPRHHLTRKAAGLALLALVFALPAAAEDLWIHVKVDEAGGDNARVTVNLPISLVESVLPMIESAGEIEDGRIVIDDSDVSIDDLRRILTALTDSPDATFAEVETDTERIVFFKDGDYLRVETDASAEGTEIRAHFPIAVLEALVSDRTTGSTSPPRCGRSPPTVPVTW